MRLDPNKETGVCENCGLTGILYRIPIMEPQRFSLEPPPPTSSTYEVKRFCAGCVEQRQKDQEAA